MYIKEFDAWNEVKKRVQSETGSVSIRAGEIRWVAIGVNVGSEIDGKGVSFTRPGLILHVIGSQLALVIPMSTKTREVPGYFPIFFKDQWMSLCFNQMKVLSQKRIYGRLGKVADSKLDAYKIFLKGFFGLSGLV